MCGKKKSFAAFEKVSVVCLMVCVLAVSLCSCSENQVDNQQHSKEKQPAYPKENDMVNQEMNEHEGEQNKPFEYLIAELPETLISFPKWNFDVEGHQREQKKMLVEDEDGFLLLKNEDYDANPCKENLWPVNSTIRWQNMENEKFAVQQLDGAGYPRCDELMRDKLGYHDTVEMEVQGWKIEDDVYMALTCDTTGAWEVRRYRFCQLVKGVMQEIAQFDILPTPEIARVARGVAKGIPEACNNMAVMMVNKEVAMFSADDEEIERLLDFAVERKCAAAVKNLYFFCIDNNKLDKAIGLLQRHGALCLSKKKIVVDACSPEALEALLKENIKTCSRKDKFELLLMFAAKGTGAAYFELGSFLIDQKEPSEAAKLFSRGAELGNMDCKHRLAELKFAGGKADAGGY